MSIFEYDKDKEEKKLRKAEFEAGLEAGRKELLTQQIQRKLSKGKSLNEIADELEESISVIQNVLNDCEVLK